MCSYTAIEKSGVNHYNLGGKEFRAFYMTTESLCKTLQDLGLVEIKVCEVPAVEKGYNLTFMTATKTL